MATPTPSSHVEAYDQSKYWVAPARNYISSTRLRLQHPLPLKVADLACGNGTWLTELHSYLAKHGVSAQPDGFDIHPVNLPHADFLLATVSLKQLDILAKPLPAELLGTYDVVHIRAFASVIPDGDLTPTLSVAYELLKPGGFPQWEGCGGDRFIAESPSP
ncbi:hypothetical protein O1611_g6762 [Lasiodiplodia mahajangana]|uniref:Uncharacterized protein n=1 Tax=Lasiodiplodia mahajangana TaxID=1108764 RepID=A0ACC2JH76_9PEZI|nr:hypothetical protein O1611_g6762 [Lasiodiplodia mahajangana]